jgi:hypothetical protein
MLISKIKVDKNFIIANSNNSGIVEYRKTGGRNCFFEGIYFICNDVEYRITPQTFDSLKSNLKKYSTTKNGKEVSSNREPYYFIGDVVSDFYRLYGLQ